MQVIIILEFKNGKELFYRGMRNKIPISSHTEPRIFKRHLNSKEINRVLDVTNIKRVVETNIKDGVKL